MRQAYVEEFRTEILESRQSLDTLLRSFIYFVNDPDAVARGEVPECWRQAVAQGRI